MPLSYVRWSCAHECHRLARGRKFTWRQEPPSASRFCLSAAFIRMRSRTRAAAGVRCGGSPGSSTTTRTRFGRVAGGPWQRQEPSQRQGELRPPGRSVGFVLFIAHPGLGEAERIAVADLAASYLARPGTIPPRSTCKPGPPVPCGAAWPGLVRQAANEGNPLARWDSGRVSRSARRSYSQPAPRPVVHGHQVPWHPENIAHGFAVRGRRRRARQSPECQWSWASCPA
jgi:hypothetical protein